jgi:hypothetical protein
MNQKHSPTPDTRDKKLWRVRLWASASLTALMAFLAPLTPSHTPTLDTARANNTETVKESPPDIEPREYARLLARSQYDWGDAEYKCLSILWGKESAWNHLSDNPHSSAFGIAQMLREKSKDPYQQIRNGLRYIEHRYSSPCNAWKFWQRNYWY